MTSAADTIEELVNQIAPLWVVLIYEGDEVSWVAGPFNSFGDATNWSPNRPDGQDPVVFALFPAD